MMLITQCNPWDRAWISKAGLALFSLVVLAGCVSAVPTGPQSRSINELDIAGRLQAVQEAMVIVNACADEEELKVEILGAKLGLVSKSSEQGGVSAAIPVIEVEGAVKRSVQAGVSLSVRPETKDVECGFVLPGTRGYRDNKKRLPDVPAAINVLRAKLVPVVALSNCLTTQLRLLVRYDRKGSGEAGFDLLGVDLAVAAEVFSADQEEVVFDLKGPCRSSNA